MFCANASRISDVPTLAQARSCAFHCATLALLSLAALAPQIEGYGRSGNVVTAFVQHGKVVIEWDVVGHAVA